MNLLYANLPAALALNALALSLCVGCSTGPRTQPNGTADGGIILGSPGGDTSAIVQLVAAGDRTCAVFVREAESMDAGADAMAPSDAGAPDASVDSGQAAIVANRAFAAASFASDLLCWGDGDQRAFNEPAFADRVVAVALGSPSCALLRDGTVQCWGDNEFGELGVPGGGRGAPALASTVVGPTDVRTIAVARRNDDGGHVCVIDGEARVWCWGRNDHGQLGDGGRTSRFMPRPIVGLAFAATSLSLGPDFSCALAEGGQAFCWGRADHGQLGSGTRFDSSTPQRVALGDVTRLSAGAEHACAVRAGRVYCWGANDTGQLGDNGFSTDRFAPIRTSVEATAVAAGAMHTCALQSQGGVRCWGANDAGQTGSTLLSPSGLPSSVPTLSAVLEITAGERHSCARVQGGVRCWGANDLGQLGDGTSRSNHRPVSVNGL